MGLLNVSTRALLADQVVLQTTGHNIANVNTPGYSRQSVALQTVPGQLPGNGYIGQGGDGAGSVGSRSEVLTRQSAAAGAAQSADAGRAERLGQLQDVFSGGRAGPGAALNDLLKALADVPGAPPHIPARRVVLTRIDETAARLRTAAGRMDEIQSAASAQLHSSVGVVNDLAMQMAA